MSRVAFRVAPLAGGDQHVAARVLLQSLLREEFGLEGELRLEHDAEGRPVLCDHPALAVSLSHCPRAVAAAVGQGMSVGIDVEARRRIADGLVRRVCTAAEQASVAASADPTMAFLALWTRKEAVLKCLGTGIRGFGSLVTALDVEGVEVSAVVTGMDGVVAALATAATP